MDNWGEIKVIKVTEGSDFWALFEELANDNSSFIENKNYLLESYRDGRLYSLFVEENLWMYRNNTEDDALFCKNSNYLLPCFCVVENKTAMILWVHSRARRKGFGTNLVKLLEINEVYNPLPQSINFWESTGLL